MTTELQKCVECGHDEGVDENGICRGKDYDPETMPSCLCHGCLCKCVFPVLDMMTQAVVDRAKEDGLEYVDRPNKLHLERTHPSDKVTLADLTAGFIGRRGRVKR